MYVIHVTERGDMQYKTFIPVREYWKATRKELHKGG